MVRQPGRIRWDDPTGQVSFIADLTTGKHMLLFHAQKAAMMEIPRAEKLPQGPGPFAMFSRPVETLWNLQDGTEKSLGEKEVDGQPAGGFEIRQDEPEYQYRIVVWANRDSGRPIQVEMTLSNPPDPSQSATMVMSHSDLDAKLGESLFRLEPPAEYTVAHEKTLTETVADTSATMEGEKIENVLELWTAGNKDQAIETLLTVDWTKPMTFSSRGYLSTMTEKAFIALKPKELQQVRQKTSELATQLHEIVRTTWDLSQKERSNRDYTRAEAHRMAALNLGKLPGDNQDHILAIQMLVLPIQKRTLTELKTLYQETNRLEDLSRVERQISTTAL